ncbi:MAG TPA: hypothetical protein VL979_01580 [Solirubrobacteraceae bacterium]|nr:hypothetical protein [Solirubrobacteraceae bacterium]
MAQGELQLPASRSERPRGRRAFGRALLAGGTAGNELLTACTGAALIALLAILGVTILRIGSLLWVHLFVGLALIGPLALKLASTGYRFVRYYGGDARYRSAGPPPILLRAIGPVVVASTLVVLASGVALLLTGPSGRATWLPIHKLSFFVWIAFMAVHVLGHLPAVGAGLRADYGGPLQRLDEGAPGRSGRALSLAAAIVLGLVLAILLIPEFGAWVHAQSLHRQ